MESVFLSVVEWMDCPRENKGETQQIICVLFLTPSHLYVSFLFMTYSLMGDSQ